MRVIYDGVDLLPVETHYFELEPVYDPSGVDYLYTRVGGAFRGLINGISSVREVVNGPPINYGFRGSASLSTGGTIYRPRPVTTIPVQPGATVPGDFGIKAATPSNLREIVADPVPPGGGPNDSAITHMAIRHRLSVPRKSLYIFHGTGMESGNPQVGTQRPPNPQVASLFIESPSPGFRCDCKNGPFPRVLSCVQAVGDATTLLVDFGIETFINEADINDVRPISGLISNRFSQSHAVDENGFTSINTTGVAIFRTDMVYDAGSPDAFRQWLFMPVPLYFTRVINYVRAREDGTGVEYSYTDAQAHTNFVAGSFTKAASIHIVHSQSIVTQADLAGAALQTYERALNIRQMRKFAKADVMHHPEADKATDRLARAISRLAKATRPPSAPKTPPVPKKP